MRMLLSAKPLLQAGKGEVPRLAVSLWGIMSTRSYIKHGLLDVPLVPPLQVGGRSAAQGPKAALQVDSFLD